MAKGCVKGALSAVVVDDSDASPIVEGSLKIVEGMQGTASTHPDFVKEWMVFERKLDVNVVSILLRDMHAMRHKGVIRLADKLRVSQSTPVVVLKRRFQKQPLECSLDRTSPPCCKGAYLAFT